MPPNIFRVEQYSLPFGIFGSIAYKLKAKKDVETIFRYRTEVVKRLFAS